MLMANAYSQLIRKEGCFQEKSYQENPDFGLRNSLEGVASAAKRGRVGHEIADFRFQKDGMDGTAAEADRNVRAPGRGIRREDGNH